MVFLLFWFDYFIFIVFFGGGYCFLGFVGWWFGFGWLVGLVRWLCVFG